MDIMDLFNIKVAAPSGATNSARRPGVNRHFPKGGPRYRVTHTIKDGWGREVRWIWTTNRNLDGYFLFCREVVNLKTKMGFRDKWGKRKTRWRAKEWAMRQFNRAPQSTFAYPLRADGKKHWS